MFTRITKFFVKPPSGQRKQRGKWTVPSVSEEFYLVSKACMCAELQTSRTDKSDVMERKL